MKKTAAAIVALTALSGMPAMAADMALKAPPPAPEWNWTGFYAGINGGYGWYTNADPIIITNNLGVSSLPFPGIRPNGPFFGGQIGANYQFGRVVIGAEADGDFADLRAGYTNVLLGGNALTTDTTVHSFASIRARVGLAFGQFLVFATGGGAEGRIRNFQDTNGVAPGLLDRYAGGAVWGGGVEYAISRGWSVKAEYQDFMLGSYSIVAPVVPPNGVVVHSNSLHNDFQTVSLGLNYKFNWLPAK